MIEPNMIEPSQYARTAAEGAPRPRDSRRRLRAAVRHMALSTVSLIRRLPDRNVLRPVYTHNVFDDQVQRFAEVIDALLERGTFVGTAEAVEMAAGLRPIDRPTFHLSFDDGFLNNATNAARILRERGVPAMFFVPTSLVGAGWEAARRYSLEQTGYNGVIEIMKWGDVERLKKWGFEIGSHTRTHARLSDVDGEVLVDEVFGSREELERRLGDCHFIAWPYGRQSDISVTALNAIRDAGYKACFSAVRGSIPGPVDLFQLPRHQFESHWPLRHTLLFASGFRERV